MRAKLLCYIGYDLPKMRQIVRHPGGDKSATVTSPNSGMNAL